MKTGSGAFGRYEIVVFDWDGTIADSVAQVVQALQQAARQLALPALDTQRTRALVGLGMNELLAELLPSLPASQYQAFTDHYRRCYFGSRHQVDVPFAGIPELLQALAGQGRQLAVATGKSRAGLDRALQSTGLARYFSSSRCAGEGPSKPAPWMLASLAEELGASASRMVMVGDTIHDIDMARAFGCACIGVHYDAEAPGTLRHSQPDALAGSVAALAELLGAGAAAPGG